MEFNVKHSMDFPRKSVSVLKSMGFYEKYSIEFSCHVEKNI